MQSMMVKENVYLRNNVSFKKETEEIVLLQVKGLIIIAQVRTEKNSCMFLSSTKYTFEGHKILCTKYHVAIV